MKKQFIKGILAAALAFATVLSIPQSKALNDAAVTAHAACSHNYRHYGSSSGWVTSYWVDSNTEYQYQENYSVCVNCGYKQKIGKTHHRYKVTQYFWWDGTAYPQYQYTYID